MSFVDLEFDIEWDKVPYRWWCWVELEEGREFVWNVNRTVILLAFKSGKNEEKV